MYSDNFVLDSVVFKNSLTIGICSCGANLSSCTSRSGINICWFSVLNKTVITQNKYSGLFMAHAVTV